MDRGRVRGESVGGESGVSGWRVKGESGWRVRAESVD